MTSLFESSVLSERDVTKASADSEVANSSREARASMRFTVNLLVKNHYSKAYIRAAVMTIYLQEIKSAGVLINSHSDTCIFLRLSI